MCGTHVAPEAAKTRNEGGAGQKRVMARPRRKKVAPAREGSKKAEALDLKRRPKGVTLKEIMKAHRLAGPHGPGLRQRELDQEAGAQGRVLPQ